MSLCLTGQCFGFMFCDRCSTHVLRHEKINICVTVWAWKALQHSFVEDLVPGTLAQCYRQVVDLGSNLGGLGLGYYGGIFEEVIQIQTPFLHSCPLCLLSSFPPGCHELRSFLHALPPKPRKSKDQNLRNNGAK